MKQLTYAEYQYKGASSALREMRWLDKGSDHYEYLQDKLDKNFEKPYVQAAWKSMGLKDTRTYEERPIYHRSANIARVWLKLREFRKREGLVPNYPMDYI